MNINVTKKVLSSFIAGAMAVTAFGGVIPEVMPSLNTTLTASAAETSGDYGDDTHWSFDESTGTLTISGTGVVVYDGRVTYDEQSLPWYSFREDIKSLVVEDGITDIPYFTGDDGYISLSNVSLADSVKNIDSQIFSKTPLQTQMFNEAFNSSDGLGYYDNWLVCVDYTKGLEMKNVTLRPGTIGIGLNTFSLCPVLESVDIPDGVRYIGSAAFMLANEETPSSFKNVILPESVEFIDMGAFRNSALENITIKNPNCVINGKTAICNSFDTDTQKASYDGIIYGYTNSTAEVYASCYGFKFESIGEVPAPDSTGGSCGDDLKWAFDKDTRTITISGTGEMDYFDPVDNDTNSNGSYWDTPWHGLENYVKTVKVEEGVTSISSGAFSDFGNLTEVSLPSTLKEVSCGAFRDTGYYNNNLVTDENGLQYLNNWLESSSLNYKEIQALEELDIAPGTIGITSGNDIGSMKNLKKVNIPDGLRYISDSAFSNLKNLETVDLPASVEYIGVGAFRATGLKSITINNPDCEIAVKYGSTICNSYDYTSKKGTFEGTIYGYSDSTAEEYANNNSYKFESIGENPNPKKPAKVSGIAVDENGKITWEAANRAVSYKVAKVVNGITYYGRKVTDTSYTFEKTPASDYQLFVVAFDENGKTSESDKVDVTVEKPLGFVNDVSVNEDGNITWTKAENAVSYKVGKRINGKTTYSSMLTDTSYTFKNVPTKDYEVFVVAFDKNGKSTWGKPTAVEVGSVGVAGDIKIKNNTVTWTAPRNAVSYKVGKTVNGKTTYSGKITDTSYEFKNVPAKDYQVFVVAFDEDGNKTYSEKKTVAVGNLGVVLNPTVKDNTVSWKPVRNAVEYKVGKVVDGKTYYSGKITDTSYEFKNALKKDCQVFVVAFDKDGNRTFGPKLNVKAE